MKIYNLWQKIFFLSSLCIIPSVGVQADDIYPSEGGCSCEDYLSNVNVGFDIDEEGGASFEYYENVNNKSEVGYRSCTSDCSITFAGKCKAPVLSCNDFANDFACNVKVGDKSIGENSDAECSKDVQLSCNDLLENVSYNVKVGKKSFKEDSDAACSKDIWLSCNDLFTALQIDIQVEAEDGVICEDPHPALIGVYPGSCGISYRRKCRPEVTPTPTPAQCDYYKGYITTTNVNKNGGNNLKIHYADDLSNPALYGEKTKELAELNEKYSDCSSIAKKIGLFENSKKYQSCDKNSVVKSKYCNSKKDTGTRGSVCSNDFDNLANIIKLQTILKNINHYSGKNVSDINDSDAIKEARALACTNVRQKAVDTCGAKWNSKNTDISGCKSDKNYPEECKTICGGDSVEASYKNICNWNKDNLAKKYQEYMKNSKTRDALEGFDFDSSDFANQNIAQMQQAKCEALVEDFDNRCDLDSLGADIKERQTALNEMAKQLANVNSLSNLSCLNDFVSKSKKDCNKGGYSDDCVAINITSKFFGNLTIDKNTGYQNSDNLKVKYWNNNTSDYGVCYAADFSSHTGSNGSNKHCLDGYFYFDKDCNPVAEDTVKDQCGDIGISFTTTYEWSSPISLIFEKDYDINSEVVFSRFNLDLANQDNAWYAWKASEKAPLLVYDPNHTGEVKDATQLFGDWAFGGKRTASLAGNVDKVSGKWENGFEALGSLDRDFDGQLSGDELSDLALWFDANRDGVSQKGEVKTLAEVGVTALYFNGYKKDANGDLRLDVGYSRNINGKTEQGAAIDWYEVGAPSKVELAEYYSAMNGNESISTMELKPIVSDKKNISRKSPYAGVWNWYIDEEDLKDSSPTKGMFILSASGENEISGYTLTEKFFSKSPNNNLNSFVTMNRVQGVEEDGKLLFSSQLGNSFTDNRASISKDGKIINGQTIVVMGGKKTITYSWKAIRDE